MAGADATLQIVWACDHKGEVRAWALPYDGQVEVEGTAITVVYDPSNGTRSWTAVVMDGDQPTSILEPNDIRTLAERYELRDWSDKRYV
ncbi:hypothetical protein Mnod_8157 (plasmid) [Methylobacterium nodulans ORS 2060]|uniref:Uncharacterized protein n=2 Tax=Methylobacterium nodulans TaxID=114616 RepID=B8IX95_METNO|nr:hypothetical protein Mnod_8157 [Methylobacterium nodulans ORS 2060]